MMQLLRKRYLNTYPLLSIAAFIGRLHPVLVHLPIGILLTGLLLEALSRYPKYALPTAAVKVILCAGMLSALFSCLTGYLLSIDGDYYPSLVNTHLCMGISVFALAGLLLVKSLKQEKGRFYTAAMSGLTMVIVVTGNLGGSLTHGRDYLTASFKGPKAVIAARRPIPDIREAVVYADIIQPMLQVHCYSCHGPDRQNGGLRLDDSASIMKGGNDGLVLQSSGQVESESIET